MDAIKRVKVWALGLSMLPLLLAGCNGGSDILFNEESKFYFTGSEYGAYGQWDLNNDGRLEEEEFEECVDVGLFDRLDFSDDGWVADQELSSGVFDSFENGAFNDDDGLLDDKCESW